MENGYKIRFHGTGNVLVLELGVHFIFFFKWCISLFKLLCIFHNKKV